MKVTEEDMTLDFILENAPASSSASGSGGST